MRQQSEGYGLIEVLIAIAMLAGFAILLGQFSGNFIRTEKRVAGSASCQQRAASITGTFKMYDNNIHRSSWLPGKAGAADQWNENGITRSDSNGYSWDMTSYPRFLAPVMGAWANGTTYPSAPVAAPWVLAPPSAIHSFNGMEGAGDLAQWNNTWQLLDSASTYVGLAYMQDTNFCSSSDGVEITTHPFFQQLIQKAGSSLKQEKTYLRIQRINLTSGAVDCNPLLPIPLNRNPALGASAGAVANIRINHPYGYKLTLRVEYQEQVDPDIRVCESNTTISPGSDFILPRVQNLKIDSPAVIDPGTRNLLCGNGTALNVALSFSSNEEGVSYACRLDYGYGGAIRGTSGWVPCINFDVTMPSPLPPIQARLVQVQDVGSNLVRYIIRGLQEGNYSFHVIAFDPARNQSTVADLPFMVDLFRPTVTTVNPPAEIRPFATGVGAGHQLVVSYC